MVEAERAVQAKRKSIGRKAFRDRLDVNAEKRVGHTNEDIFILQELLRWQEFFRNDATALEFFMKLDRGHSAKKGSA